jgi:nitrate/nitrite transport system substrate-binding protein
MVKEAPDYNGIAEKVHRPDIYRDVAKEMGISAPKEDMKKETLFDGMEFDPAKPEEYAKKFAVNNIV